MRATGTEPTEPTAPAHGRGDRVRPRPPLVSPASVHLLTLVLAAAALLRANWSQWFFGDEWAFLVGRELGEDTWPALFAPHNEHWSTLPVLVYRGMLHAVGLSSYLPYVAVLIGVHLLLVHLVWRVMLGTGADPWLATGLAAVLAVLGAGSEDLLWAFQIGFVGSALFGYAAVLLVDRDRWGPGRLLGTWLLCLCSLMCSGIGVVMVAVVALLALLRRGVLHAVLVASVPAAAFTTWYLVFGRDGASGVPKSRRGLFAVPDYVANGLTQSLERGSGLPSSGAVLVLVLLAWLALRASSSRAPSAVLATAAGSVLLYALIAPGREALGIDSAGASRYTYLCIALLLPSVALLLTELLARTRWPVLVGAALSLLLVWHNLYLLIVGYGAEAAREAEVRAQVLAAADIADSGEVWVANRPEPALDPDITMEWLREARAEGWLDAGEGTYDLQDELDVRARTQVALSVRGARALPPATVVAAARVDGVPQGDCTSYAPTGPEPQLVLGVDPSTGGSARLVLAAAGEVGVELGTTGAPGVLSEPVLLATDAPAGGVSLDVVAAVDRVVVTLPAEGTTVVCGVVPTT